MVIVLVVYIYIYDLKLPIGVNGSLPRQTGNLVYPASCPIAAGIGSSLQIVELGSHFFQMIGHHGEEEKFSLLWRSYVEQLQKLKSDHINGGLNFQLIRVK